MKYTVYILNSKKDNKRYIGSTINLQKRLMQHNRGDVKSTKHRRPFRILAFREFDSVEGAALYEKKYKRSSGQIKRDIKNKKLKIVGV